MDDSLWYPPSTVGSTATASTVTPYDSDNMEVPRPYGGTCYAMGLMQAYNQFSANTSLLTYNPGAPGAMPAATVARAQKIIIFETDGAPNTTASATLQNSGSYNSYYKIRWNSCKPRRSEFPTGISGYSDNASNGDDADQQPVHANLPLGSAPARRAIRRSSKKVQIHCIGFGPRFAPG